MPSSKPSKVRKRIYTSAHHTRSKLVKSMLSEDLRGEYSVSSARLRKGDSVKIMRGEYSGVEAKVTAVHTESGRVDVEGIKQQKIAGGDAPIGIHASKLMITGLNLNDDMRKKRLGSKEGA